MLIKFIKLSEPVYNVGSPQRYGECLLLATTIVEGVKMIKNEIDMQKIEICAHLCPRYEYCPMFYECEAIKKIGVELENIYNDNSNLGVE